MAKFPRGSTHAHFPRGHRRLWGLVSNPEPNLSPCRADMNKDLKAFLARWDLAQDCAGSFERFPNRLEKDIEPHLAQGVHFVDFADMLAPVAKCFTEIGGHLRMYCD